jgi:hypothetical protein
VPGGMQSISTRVRRWQPPGTGGSAR